MEQDYKSLWPHYLPLDVYSLSCVHCRFLCSCDRTFPVEPTAWCIGPSIFWTTLIFRTLFSGLISSIPPGHPLILWGQYQTWPLTFPCRVLWKTYSLPSQVGLAIVNTSTKSGAYLCPRTAIQLSFTCGIALSSYKIMIWVNCG